MNNSLVDRRSPLGVFPGKPTPKLYDRLVELLRTRRYSRRTEQAYIPLRKEPSTGLWEPSACGKRYYEEIRQGERLARQRFSPNRS